MHLLKFHHSLPHHPSFESCLHMGTCRTVGAVQLFQGFLANKVFIKNTIINIAYFEKNEYSCLVHLSHSALPLGISFLIPGTAWRTLPYQHDTRKNIIYGSHLVFVTHIIGTLWWHYTSMRWVEVVAFFRVLVVGEMYKKIKKTIPNYGINSSLKMK